MAAVARHLSAQLREPQNPTRHLRDVAALNSFTIAERSRSLATYSWSKILAGGLEPGNEGSKVSVFAEDLASPFIRVQ